MPRKIGSVTRQTLVDAPLPEATETYTVISHNFVITNILKNLAENGFEVKEEVYRCTKDAQVASGVYRINYDNDPDMGMIFAFGNSYDKSMRFKCAVGAYIYKNNASLISKMSDWNRKHTGTADDETEETILNQIENAMVYFNELKEHKDLMKQIMVSPKRFHHLMGELYFDKLITGEQMATVRREYEKPSYNYETPKNSLWTLYNHILTALKISHPRSWMEQQTMIHLKLATEFGLIEFDDEDETTDEKQSDVSSASQGNATMFLPGYNSKPAQDLQKVIDDFNDVVTDIPIEEEPMEEDFFVDESEGVTEDLDAEEDEDWDELEKAGVITPIEPAQVTEEPEPLVSETPVVVDSSEDTITIQNEMTVDEALETYPEMTKEIAESVGVEVEEDEVPWIEDGEEPVDLEELPEEEEELEEVVDEEISADLEMQEMKTEQIIEEREAEEKPVESTGVLFDLEEVEPAYKPVVGLDQPVKIMSPEESAEKSPLPAFTNAALGLGYDKDIIAEWYINNNYDTSLSESENLANFRSWAALMDSDEPGIEDEPVIGETQEMSAEEVVEEYGEDVPEEPAVDKSSPLYVAIQNELEELYGYKPEFTYTEANDQFNIVLESGESVVLSAAYINSLV